MTTALLGAGVGLGLVAAGTGLRRAGPANGAVVAGLASGGAQLLRVASFARPAAAVRQDLAVLRRSEESLAVISALAAVGGLTLPALAYGCLSSLGIRLPIPFVPVICVSAGVAGAVLPAVLARRSASSHRQVLVHSLACWLELVALAQAGGMGVESALGAASSVAGGDSFLRIRRALDRARHGGQSPWDALGRLGRELGVGELEELAASLRLAGTEGARIRASLSAKSASLRRRQLAAAQSRANATTERLFLPSIVLMVGFLVFLVYPAGVTLSRIF